MNYKDNCLETTYVILPVIETYKELQSLTGQIILTIYIS